MQRTELIKRLKSIIQMNGHMLSVAIGSGMTTQYLIKGGADLILAMNAGRFRQMGQSAFSAFLGYSNANEMVMKFASEEILPMADGFPVICGVFMQDPTIYLYEYLQSIDQLGFSGVINYPTIICMDGSFRQSLENAGLGYEKEVEGIQLAHFLGLFTYAYVSTVNEAEQMARAGADVICVHLGISSGGILGANKTISMEMALKITSDIFDAVNKINPDVIKLVGGGPVQTPLDAREFYAHTACEGIIAGSIIERIPVERAMINTTRSFKSCGDFDSNNLISQVLNGTSDKIDYGDFMTEYLKNNYHKNIHISDIAAITHMSVPRLNVIFRQKTASSFTQYLINYRMEKAKEFLKNTDYQIKEISLRVGYEDYSQFVKMFRKKIGQTPLDYRNNIKNFNSDQEEIIAYHSTLRVP